MIVISKEFVQDALKNIQIPIGTRVRYTYNYLGNMNTSKGVISQTPNIQGSIVRDDDDSTWWTSVIEIQYEGEEKNEEKNEDSSSSEYKFQIVKRGF